MDWRKLRSRLKKANEIDWKSINNRQGNPCCQLHKPYLWLLIHKFAILQRLFGLYTDYIFSLRRSSTYLFVTDLSNFLPNLSSFSLFLLPMIRARKIRFLSSHPDLFNSSEFPLFKMI